MAELANNACTHTIELLFRDANGDILPNVTALDITVDAAMSGSQESRSLLVANNNLTSVIVLGRLVRCLSSNPRELPTHDRKSSAYPGKMDEVPMAWTTTCLLEPYDAALILGYPQSLQFYFRRSSEAVGEKMLCISRVRPGLDQLPRQ
jgi:hypothetical protein